MCLFLLSFSQSYNYNFLRCPHSTLYPSHLHHNRWILNSSPLSNVITVLVLIIPIIVPPYQYWNSLSNSFLFSASLGKLIIFSALISLKIIVSVIDTTVLSTAVLLLNFHSVPYYFSQFSFTIPHVLNHLLRLNRNHCQKQNRI